MACRRISQIAATARWSAEEIPRDLIVARSNAQMFEFEKNSRSGGVFGRAPHQTGGALPGFAEAGSRRIFRRSPPA